MRDSRSLTCCAAGGRAVCFVDNTVALSKAVHGYANAPDMAAITNVLHVCDACLGVDSWFEWVPSAANIADIPSRDPLTWDGDVSALWARVSARVAPSDSRRMAMPTMAELESPAAMMRRASAL